jgi:hypothetical protein
LGALLWVEIVLFTGFSYSRPVYDISNCAIF